MRCAGFDQIELIWSKQQMLAEVKRYLQCDLEICLALRIARLRPADRALTWQRFSTLASACYFGYHAAILMHCGRLSPDPYIELISH
jgi:hypothetical protein